MQASEGPLEVACGARAVLPPGRLAVLSLPLFYAVPAAWPSASRAAGPLGPGQGPAGRASQPARRELDQGLPGVAAGPVYPAGSDAPHKGTPIISKSSEPETIKVEAAAVPGDGVECRAAAVLEVAAACAAGREHTATFQLPGAVLVAGTAIFPL